MSIASDIHDAFFATCKAEEPLDELCSRIYPGDNGWDEYTTDYYDNSIEMYGVAPTMDAHAALREAGFSLVWQHDHNRSPVRCTCGSMGPK